eukprot:274107-Alexandrium_andersonii.AAC.1
MSASLVGSEMCIRDRIDSLRGPPGKNLVLRCKVVSALGSFCWGQAPLPVSYTHLTLPTICSV